MVEDKKDKLRALGKAADDLYPEVIALLSGPDATSAGLAREALESFWETLRRYPVYRNLKPHIESMASAARTKRQWLRAATDRVLSDRRSKVPGAVRRAG